MNATNEHFCETNSLTKPAQATRVRVRVLNILDREQNELNTHNTTFAFAIYNKLHF
jgi:hypothetical protein